MNDVAEVLVFLAVVAVGIVSVCWTFSRSRSMLEEWASLEGFELLNSTYCWFQRGPFFWSTSRNQAVYYVTVRDARGEVHHGWVRCGSWWLGLLSDQVEARWDDSPAVEV